jgi:RNA polymerase sigma factor (sigma-70 family)
VGENNVAEQSIHQLYDEARTGDPTAEKRLFVSLGERFGLFLQRRIGSRQDAEEVVQDTLAAIAEQYRQIEITTSFAAWAYRVLENKLLYYYRSKKAQARKLEQFAESGKPVAVHNPDPAFRRRLLDCIKKVSRANIRHARILNLHYQGYTVEDICGRLEISRNNLYTSLSRARSVLKSCIEKGDIG